MPRYRPAARYKIGDLVTAFYRGDSGIVYEVTDIDVHGTCYLAPRFDPLGLRVTKKHGYQNRKLGAYWLRPWAPIGLG